MKTDTTPDQDQASANAPSPSADEIRDYAFHLYEQGGNLPGNDVEDWREAEACLRSSIPKECTRTRLHYHTQLSERAALKLVKHGRS